MRAHRQASLFVAALALLVACWAGEAKAQYVGTAAGYLPVGTTTVPASMLGVYGGMTIGTSYISTAAPANGAIIQGNVGIGTTAPQSLLHVQAGEVQVGSSGASCATANAGAIRYNAGTLYYCDNASTWESIDSSGTSPTGDYYVATQTATATSGQGLFGGSSTLGGILTGYGSTSDVTLQNRSGTAAFEILANSTNIYMPGNVGIGTAAPYAKLQVNAADNALGITLFGNSGTNFNMIGGTGVGTGIGWRAYALGSNFTLPSTNIPTVAGMVSYTHANAIGFGTEDTTDTGITFWNGSGTPGTSMTERMRINPSGNVGIGTTSPQSKLHVQAGEVQVGSSGASCATANAGAIRYSGGTLYYCDNASTWESVDSSGTSPTGDYYIATQTATPTSGQGLFGGAATLGGILAGYGSTADVTLENRNDTPALQILANSTNVYMPGNVGIGSTAPVANLDIQGGTVTTSTPVINIAQTWNNSGTNFDAPIFENITNTASGSSSVLMDLQVGGVTQFNVTKNGTAEVNNLLSGGYLRAGSGSAIYWNGHTALSQVGDGALEISNYLQTNNSILSVPTSATLHLGNFDVAAPVAQTLGVQNVVAGTTNTAGANFTITGSQGTGTGAGGAIVFQTAPVGTSGTTQNALTTAMTIAPTGYVGIGTTAPQSMLHVQAGEVQVGSSGASCASANAGAIRYSAGTLYYCDNASTWESVDSSGGADTGDYYIAMQMATPTTGQGMFGGSSTFGGVLAGYGSTADVTLENRSNTPALEILANSTNVYMPGNVGIGTTVAGALFTVGNNLFEVNASGTVLAGTWNGTAVGTGYGGTGLATVTGGLSNLLGNPAAANYAIDCTSGTSCTNVAMTSAAVTSFSAGTTGFTPSTATTGAVTLAGTLAIANGGTGAATTTAYSVFGNNTGSTAAPAFVTAPILSGAIETLQSIGTSSTNGVMLYNTTAATSTVAQWSPRLHFEGYGYGSSASKAVDFIEEVQPALNGSSAITGNLVWSNSTAGGSYSPLMTLTSGGNVGIGTTSPTSLLDLNINNGSFLNLGEGGSGNGASLYFTRYSDGSKRQFLTILPTLASPNEDIIVGSASSMWNSASLQTFGGRLILNSSGNVGIGTTSPAQTLEVNGTAKIDTGLIASLLYPPSDSTTAIQIDKANGTSNVVDINTTNGLVGIGTTTPFAGLHIITTGSGLSSASEHMVLGQSGVSNNGGKLAFINNGGSLTGWGQIGFYDTSNQGNFDIGVSGGGSNILFSVNGAGTSGTEIMRVSGTSSNVGIGTTTTSSSNKLEVNGATTIGYPNTAGPTNGLLVNGNVGIGTTSPQATLDVNGYARLKLQSSQPVACSSTNQGAIALNHLAQMCACNGTSWIFADSVGASCSW